jgi:hypothetical protein
MMKLFLSDEQSNELRTALDQVLSDLGFEIAATDNPTYRDGLRARRELLVATRRQLEAVAVEAEDLPRPRALEEELAHPGD